MPLIVCLAIMTRGVGRETALGEIHLAIIFIRYGFMLGICLTLQILGVGTDNQQSSIFFVDLISFSVNIFLKDSLM